MTATASRMPAFERTMDPPLAPVGGRIIVDRPGTVAEAIDAGVMSGRLWLYSNYHCNLACAYCLTESAPGVPARELGRDRMVALAQESAALGFTGVGVTGGEPFLIPYLVDAVAEMAASLPVTVLTNGTLFTPRRLERLRAWFGLPVQLQLSLDRPDPVENDAMRGPENYRKVVSSIPKLVGMGLKVRIASTLESIDPDELDRLCGLHRHLGVPDEDHIVRPIVSRGRAAVRSLGEPAGPTDVQPELTITVDGAFWSPFGPTVAGGRLDTDMLVTGETDPLEIAALALVRLAWASSAPRQERGIRFR